MVYEKSSLGFNEFISQNRTLSVRERQVLLLVNGVRNIDDLEKFFKKEHLTITIDKLVSNGYIQPFRKAGHLSGNKSIFISEPSSLPFNSKITPKSPVNPAKIAAIKSILIESAEDYLGIMGNNIKICVKSCSNEYDLRSCISVWHMAMRESKLGRESISFLMEQIHKTLENRLLDVDSNTH